MVVLILNIIPPPNDAVSLSVSIEVAWYQGEMDGHTMNIDIQL